jgi:putative ATP-dependent endonuclease of OLD family
MRLEKITINHYRSIEQIEILFPSNRPVVLFGPNNAGKSNILSAINRILGERYPTYIEMIDSDYYQRDKEKYPTTDICAKFDEPLYYDRFNNAIKTIAVRYENKGGYTENLFHNGNGSKIFPTSEQRANCQSFLIDAERNIQSAFNYGSQYSLLSKFSKHIHTALSANHKEELTEAFEQIKASFEKTTEFSSFFEHFSSSLKGSVKGFVHSLEVDFSAYDPNNYAKSLRIYAKEGNIVRGFEEFGTGEQQVLLMAFAKAFMEVFSSEHFVLIIEEPEAHLHPLAQKWLKEYIIDMCATGIQVVISTHSADFIDPEYLDGLVRVYKDNGTTKAKQLSQDDLVAFCTETGVPSEKISPNGIVDYYSTKLVPDQLKGMFAETIILVEGATEYYALPIYLKRIGFSLSEHGVEIVNCMGKNNIPLFWRLFQAYGYRCYAVFDGDSNQELNSKTFVGLINDRNWFSGDTECEITDSFAYFGKDFETYFKTVVKDYNEIEQRAFEDYQIISKPGKARMVAQNCAIIPDFIKELSEKLI